MTARMMEHEEAMKNLVAERYLLGELTENDREAYEEHLFSCPVCFEQVRAGTEFVGHLRRMGAEKPVTQTARPGFLASLRQPLTALAFSLLMIVSGVSFHQYRVIDGMKQAQVTPSIYVSDGAKGAGENEISVGRNKPFGVKFDLLHPGDFSSYEGRVLSGSGNIEQTFSISSEQAEKNAIYILLDSGVIGQGAHYVAVNGISPDGHKIEITKSSFQVKLKE